MRYEVNVGYGGNTEAAHHGFTHGLPAINFHHRPDRDASGLKRLIESAASTRRQGPQHEVFALQIAKINPHSFGQPVRRIHYDEDFALTVKTAVDIGFPYLLIDNGDIGANLLDARQNVIDVANGHLRLNLGIPSTQPVEKFDGFKSAETANGIGTNGSRPTVCSIRTSA
ncbi:MAG: hypothetical protein VW268_09880 [Rhodospirillaceae bacterium]